MALEDASPSCSTGFVRSVERIGEDGCCPNKKEKTTMVEKAHSAIVLSLDDKVLRQVSKKKTAAGVWTKLEALYMT